MTVYSQLGGIVLPGELVSLIARQASDEGPTYTSWPGLIFYRFEQRISTYWDEVSSASLCMIAQGRERLRFGSVNYFYDQFHHLVIKRGLRFQVDILQAAIESPFLSIVLQLPPDLVNEVNDEMNRLLPKELRIEPSTFMPDVYVRVLDLPLVQALQRFLIALDSESDRNVLAPIYLREIVYWMLRSEQRLSLNGATIHEIPGSAIPAVISFMKEKMDQTLTVGDLAEAVCMSESSFAHLFKTAVGVSPLRFLKRMRLEHARECLLNGSTVKKAASNVSYTSVSHFSGEFKRHFGESPKAYTKMQRDLGLDAAGGINHK